MKVYEMYNFHDETNKPIVLYEFDTNDEAMNFCNECDKRKTRQTCFASDSQYYVGEYITDEVAKILINNNHVNQSITKDCDYKNLFCFYTDMEAYGDSRYYFDNKTKQFYRDFMSIGD